MRPTGLILIAVFSTSPYAAHAACSDRPAPRVNWHRCDKHGANLKQAIMEYANLEDADLTAAGLARAGLIGANLSYADLRGATGVNLDGADTVFGVIR